MSDILDTPEKRFLLDFVTRNEGALSTLNDSLFYFGELGMQEFRSAELMCDLLEDHGFGVDRGVSGFPTGFLATYGHGSPVVAVHTEYDGSPRNSQRSGVAEKAEITPGAPGHCEGHNSNGAVMILAAIALRHTMERFHVGGTMKVVGAPSEESLISRPYYVRDGIFDNVDVAFHDHIFDEFRSDYGQQLYSAISADFVFRGESTHAAVYPYKGRDALDAVVLLDVGVAQYREHMEPHMSAQRVITQGGTQPNLVPDVASAWWMFRHPTALGARALFERGTRIAQGAAMMTDTELAVVVRSAVWPVRLNQPGAEMTQRHLEAIGMPEWTDAEHDFAKALQRAAGAPEIGLRTHIEPVTGPGPLYPAANDAGDVSWKVPMVSVLFPGQVPGLGPHHWAAGAPLATSIAHKGALVGAQGLGASMLEYLVDTGDLLARTWAAFERDAGGTVFETLLPPGQEPPLDLNNEEMERYRAKMEQHYVIERPEILVQKS